MTIEQPAPARAQLVAEQEQRHVPGRDRTDDADGFACHDGLAEQPGALLLPLVRIDRVGVGVQDAGAGDLLQSGDIGGRSTISAETSPVMSAVRSLMSSAARRRTAARSAGDLERHTQVEGFARGFHPQRRRRPSRRQAPNRPSPRWRVRTLRAAWSSAERPNLPPM